MSGKDIVLSVVMITYNQDAFISKAIEGVLNQECDFEIELIIADDCSSDNTSVIVNGFIQDHPKGKIIKYLKHSQNIGMMPNFIWALKQAKSKYIALCEGDDYWTYPKKIQKQVDFLEHYDSYILCFHKANKFVNGKLEPDTEFEKRYNAIVDPNEISTESLLKQKSFIHTCSAVFRNIPLEFPFEIMYSPVGDYLLFILLSYHGKIKRFDEPWSVYRVGSGIYSTLSSQEIAEKKLLYHICITSMLKNESHKELMLNETFNCIDNYKKEIIYSTELKLRTNSNLKDNISFVDLVKVLILKIKEKVS